MKEKQCTKCKLFKPLNEFYVQKRKKDNLSSWCKQCVRSAVVKIQKKEKARRKAARQKDLTPKQLCEAYICPACKRKTMIPRRYLNPIEYWCGDNRCGAEYDKDGNVIGE